MGGISVTQAQQPDPLTITKDGNVGVGTTSPGQRLNVIGNGLFGDITSRTLLYSTYDSQQNPFLEVGYGTSHSGITPFPTFVLSNNTTSTSNSEGIIGQITFANRSITDNDKRTALINSSVDGASNSGTLQFYTASAGTIGERLRITSGGNVGIGTPMPAAKLDIKDRVALQDSNGRNYFKDVERNDGKGLRVGALWGQYGVFAESGFGALGGADGVTLQNGALTVTGLGNISISNRLGIGSVNPTRGKVEVIGSANTSFPGLTGYLQQSLVGFEVSNPSVRNGTVNLPLGLGINLNAAVSLYADNAIAASMFVAFSDERLKRLGGRSDMARDLATLMSIEVTDYSYIDSIAKGTGTQKKVTGQQVERVFPQAVSKATDVVPDIYQRAAIKDGWITLGTNLKKGERVRLIGKNQDAVHEVLEVANGKFRTSFAPEGDQVFVYGREVNDARRVDYEAISMLNVSATQQIKKEKDAEVKALQEENAALRSQLVEQEKRLAAIEALLVSNQPTVSATSVNTIKQSKQ